MKKFLILIIGLVLVAACAVPPTNREAAPVNSSDRGAAAIAPLTEAEAIAKEKAVWDALKAKNYDAFAAMLATDYMEVGSDGVYDKAGIITYLKDLEFTDATFADWKLLPLGKNAALLMYNLTLKGKFKGQDFPPGPYRVGSAWTVRDGKWQATFYQETRGGAAEPHPPGHTPTPTPAASPAVSPAASGPKPNEIGAIADPIAREKAVYEVLKRKDYDTFAAMLDDAQVEVWTDGFHTRAETLEGVKMFDATKATQSDFKTVRLTDEAEVVTYVVAVSGPKPERSRASTIWIKRGDSWKAIYHQGTAIEESAASPTPAKP
jgi:hypothetical protein